LGKQLAGYSLYGKAGQPNPPSLLIDAVARGDVDLAIVWGPFAGYFAKRQSVPLKITPVSPPAFLAIPFTYGISVGVRKSDRTLQAEIDQVLSSECRKIAVLLDQYGIPQTGENRAKCESPQSAAFLH